jgi:hypothetical protein
LHVCASLAGALRGGPSTSSCRLQVSHLLALYYAGANRAFVSIRQHTSVYVSIRRRVRCGSKQSIRQHASARTQQIAERSSDLSPFLFSTHVGVGIGVCVCVCVCETVMRVLLSSQM